MHARTLVLLLCALHKPMLWLKLYGTQQRRLGMRLYFRACLHQATGSRLSAPCAAQAATLEIQWMARASA